MPRSQKTRTLANKIGNSKGSNKRKRKNNGEKMPRHMTSKNNLVVKRLTRYTTLGCSAGGVIPNTNFTANDASNTSDWTYCQNLWQQFRVRQIKVRFIPNQTTASPITTYQSCIAVARFWGSAASRATTYSTVIQEAECIYRCTTEDFSFETNFSGFADGQLWTPTSASPTIPASNNYGIVVQSSPTVMIANSQVFDLVFEFFVEFMNTW
jgi:hypothetical protein